VGPRETRYAGPVSVCERAGREMVGQSAGFDVGVRPGRPVCAGSDRERAGCRMGERAASAFVGKGVGFGFPAGGLVCWFRGTPRERASSVGKGSGVGKGVGDPVGGEGTVERGRFEKEKWEKF
jgi:hypothetical protein